MLSKEIIPTENINTQTQLYSSMSIDNTRRNVEGPLILNNPKHDPITITIKLAEVSEVHSIAIFSEDLTSVRIGTKISQESSSQFSKYMDSQGTVEWETATFSAQPSQQFNAPEVMPTIEITLTLTSSIDLVRVEVEVWGCFQTPGKNGFVVI